MTGDRRMSFDNWLKKRRSPFLRERLARENRDIEPGMIIRGWHPKPMSWRKAKRRAQRGLLTIVHRVPGGAVHDGWRYDYHNGLLALAEDAGRLP